MSKNRRFEMVLIKSDYKRKTSTRKKESLSVALPILANESGDVNI